MQQRKFDEIVIVVFSLFVHGGRSFSFCTKREHEAKTSSRGQTRRGNRNTTSLRGILSQTASLQKLRAQRTRTTKALCDCAVLLLFLMLLRNQQSISCTYLFIHLQFSSVESSRHSLFLRRAGAGLCCAKITAVEISLNYLKFKRGLNLV